MSGARGRAGRGGPNRNIAPPRRMSTCWHALARGVISDGNRTPRHLPQVRAAEGPRLRLPQPTALLDRKDAIAPLHFQEYDLPQRGLRQVVLAEVEYDLSYHCRACKLCLVDHSRSLSRAEAQELAATM